MHINIKLYQTPSDLYVWVVPKIASKSCTAINLSSGNLSKKFFSLLFLNSLTFVSLSSSKSMITLIQYSTNEEVYTRSVFIQLFVMLV